MRLKDCSCYWLHLFFLCLFQCSDNLAMVVGTGYGNGFLTWHVTCEMDPFLVFSEVRHLYRL